MVIVIVVVMHSNERNIILCQTGRETVLSKTTPVGLCVIWMRGDRDRDRDRDAFQSRFRNQLCSLVDLDGMDRLPATMAMPHVLLVLVLVV